MAAVLNDEACQDSLAALDRVERLATDMETALLAVFLDPLTSHGARALCRETLGIPFIPFAPPQEMLDAHRAAREEGTA